MYNPETGEIAKPSELLASVKAYMSVLQSVENYVNIDITRVFNNVLLQQTQQVSFRISFFQIAYFISYGMEWNGMEWNGMEWKGGDLT